MHMLLGELQKQLSKAKFLTALLLMALSLPQVLQESKLIL
jgi:hypothetical protein